MLDHLKARWAQRQQQEANRREREAKAAQLRQEIGHNVAMLRDLLADARYADYTQLLSEALQARRRELIAYRADADTDAEAMRQLGELQGRILQLQEILEMPNTFLQLADQLERSPDGDGRQPIPESSAQATPRPRVSGT